MDQPFPQLILASILLIAGVTDLRSSKIPNWLTVSAMAAGLLSHSWFDGLSGLLFSVKGLGLGLALFLLFYVMGGMGAGDVKLLAAVGSFLGTEGVVSAGIMAMLLGGIYAIAMMISRDGVQMSLRRIATIFTLYRLMPGSLQACIPTKPHPPLRYALVIGLGTLMSQWLEVPLITF